MNLTQADIYKALAANPFGKGPTRRRPGRTSIRRFRRSRSASSARRRPRARATASPTSILTKGCDTDPAMKALKKSDEDKHKEVCTKIREDGAYVEAGENDNLLVQKVAADPGTLGVLGYSATSRRMPTRSAGLDRRRRADRGDDRRPQLSRRAQALHLRQGRAHLGQAGDARLRRRLCQGCGARAVRSRARGLVPFGGADADAPPRSRRPRSSRSTRATPEVSGAAGDDASASRSSRS
jgi:phosphate transport system substrate-binding protein